MLSGLTDLGQLKLVDAQSEQLVERKGKCALQCRRGGHTGSQGNVACEDRVEPLDVATSLDDLPADTEDITCPAGFRRSLFGQTELGIVAQVEGVSTHRACAIRLDLGNHALIHRTREDETAVVIGVLTDQVDSPRGGEEASLGLKQFLEFYADLLLHSFHAFLTRFYFLAGLLPINA